MLKVSNIIGKLFKKSSQKELDRLRLIVKKINAYEAEIKDMPANFFPKKTAELKKKVKNGAELNSLIPEAFACVR